MIIKYDENIDTSIKYEPLKLHFWKIGNVLCMKILEQGDRLRVNNTIAEVSYDNDNLFFEIRSAFAPELAKTMLYIKGDPVYDDDITSYNFTSEKELQKYMGHIKEIFENINIFDTKINITEINTNVQKGGENIEFNNI
jgi:hypothetical protein